MWHLTAGLDWDTLAQMSKVGQSLRADACQGFRRTSRPRLPEGETGRVLFEVEGTDEASEAIAGELKNTIRSKPVLGLLAEIGIPARPEGPAVACRVRIQGRRGLGAGDQQRFAAAKTGSPSASLPSPRLRTKANLTPALLRTSSPRASSTGWFEPQLSKGVKDKGKMHYSVRIDNASPLILNGLAALGTTSSPDEIPKVLPGICVSPPQELDRAGERRSRQGLWAQERDQADGPQLEWALNESLVIGHYP